MRLDGTDQAADQDIRHLAHRSGGREGRYAAGIVIIASTILLTRYGGLGLGLFVDVFLVLLAAALAFYLVMRWIARLAQPGTPPNHDPLLVGRHLGAERRASNSQERDDRVS